MATLTQQEVSGIIQQVTSLPNHMFFLTDFEAMHFDFFRHVCARDFALVFESSIWESILVQAAHAERSLFHATLAVSVLTRAHYFPTQVFHGSGCSDLAVAYAIWQYNLGIKCLNARLRSRVNCTELAILGSILFMAIEGFQGYRKQMLVHLRGGLALLQSPEASSFNTTHLKTALYHTRDQVQIF
jgi:hypothetical protein